EGVRGSLPPLLDDRQACEQDLIIRPLAGTASCKQEGDMFCTDPYVALLKAQGYNVVRLPRADFSPLLLLADEGGKDLARMGHLTELLSGANAPPVKADTRAAGIS